MIRKYLKLTKRAIQLRSQLKHKPNCLFVWIPKNAGTSFYHSLNESLGMVKLKSPGDVMSFPNKGVVTFGHYHVESLLRMGIIAREYWNETYKFAAVRNPYSRALRLYHYLTWGRNARKYSIDHFLDDVIKNTPPIGCYHVHGLSQANPQTDWIYGAHGELLVDRVFRVEDMQQFESTMSEKFNTKISLKTQNSSATKKKHVVPSVSIDELRSVPERLEKIEFFYYRDFSI